MKIVTNPNNKQHLHELMIRSDQRLEKMGMCRIKSMYVVQFDKSLPEKIPSKTEFVARHDKFCEYNTTNPADWEIFCGYVKPKMVPHFIMTEDRRSTVMGKNGPEVR